jgi:hypothetical protein
MYIFDRILNSYNMTWLYTIDIINNSFKVSIFSFLVELDLEQLSVTDSWYSANNHSGIITELSDDSGFIISNINGEYSFKQLVLQNQ